MGLRICLISSIIRPRFEEESGVLLFLALGSNPYQLEVDLRDLLMGGDGVRRKETGLFLLLGPNAESVVDKALGFGGQDHKD